MTRTALLLAAAAVAVTAVAGTAAVPVSGSSGSIRATRPSVAEPGSPGPAGSRFAGRPGGSGGAGGGAVPRGSDGMGDVAVPPGPGSGGSGGSVSPGGGAVPAGPLAAATPLPPAGPIRWRWPLDPRPVVRRGFAVGPFPWSPGHRGIDLAGTVGQPVLAPGPGVVAFAGVVAGRPLVVIDNPGGLRTSLEPVTATVPVGSAVAAGQPVGRLSVVQSHCAPQACLHWGVRRGGVYLDPLTLLGMRARIILLPLGPDPRIERSG